MPFRSKSTASKGDLSLNVTDNWSISAVAAYSLGKIKNGTVPCNDLNGDGLPDNVTSAPTLGQLRNAVGSDNVAACQVSQRFGFESPFGATLTSEYTVPVSENVDAYLRGLMSFNGSSRTDPTNRFDDVGSYGLFNVFAGIRDLKGAWEVSLFAKNISTRPRRFREPIHCSPPTSFQ